MWKDKMEVYYRNRLHDWDALGEKYISVYDLPEFVKNGLTKTYGYGFEIFINDFAVETNKKCSRMMFCKCRNNIFMTEKGYNKIIEYAEKRNLLTLEEINLMRLESPFREDLDNGI